MQHERTKQAPTTCTPRKRESRAPDLSLTLYSSIYRQRASLSGLLLRRPSTRVGPKSSNFTPVSVWCQLHPDANCGRHPRRQQNYHQHPQFKQGKRATATTRRRGCPTGQVWGPKHKQSSACVGSCATLTNSFFAGVGVGMCRLQEREKEGEGQHEGCSEHARRWLVRVSPSSYS